MLAVTRLNPRKSIGNELKRRAILFLCFGSICMMGKMRVPILESRQEPYLNRSSCSRQ